MVLTLPGWRQSAGIAEETAWAMALNLPIRYQAPGGP